MPGISSGVAGEDLLHWLRVSRGPPTAAEARDDGKPVRDPALELVKQDLRALGIPAAHFRFVWSLDGSGVEEDAPRVIHLHRGLPRAAAAPAGVTAAAERVLALDLAAVVRHELGHALVFEDPRVTRTAGFRRLYGDVGVLYRVGSPIDEVTRRLRAHGGLGNPRYRRVVSLYAATHPHERFAEAVRIAMALRGDEAALAAWATQRRLAPVVEEQLVFAARWLKTRGSG